MNASGFASTPATTLRRLVPRAARLTAEALIVLSSQLAQAARNRNEPAYVVVGVLRLSLLRFVQQHLNELCRAGCTVMVFGEADSPPPSDALFECIELAGGDPLAQDWFWISVGATFSGALLAQLLPEPGGSQRKFGFEGALTGDERVVNRALLAVHLAQRRASPQLPARNRAATATTWQAFVAQIAAHPQAERLGLHAALPVQANAALPISVNPAPPATAAVPFLPMPVSPSSAMLPPPPATVAAQLLPTAVTVAERDMVAGLDAVLQSAQPLAAWHALRSTTSAARAACQLVQEARVLDRSPAHDAAWRSLLDGIVQQPPASGRLAIVAGAEGTTDPQATQLLAAVLATCGYRINLLGDDVPTAFLVEIVAQLEPAVLALAADTPAAADAAVTAADALGQTPVVIAGAAATHTTFPPSALVLTDAPESVIDTLIAL